MDLNKSNVSEDMAIELVKRLYGLDVLSIKRLVSFADQNFHIQVSQNHDNPHINTILETGYTLKIINTKRSSDPDHFDITHSIMIHQVKNGMRTPVPLPNVNGETWNLEIVPLQFEDDNITMGPKECGVFILSYIDGVPIPTVECSKNILFQWGQLLARYHNAVQDYVHPGLKNKKVFWSLENIPTIKVYMDELSEEKKELINCVLKKYSNEIEPNLKQLPKGVIHGDFNESNVLVRIKNTDLTNTVYLVDGVLDFEDTQIGTYVWDVGIMMAYSMITYNFEDVLDAPGHALAGYLSIRSLNQLERSLLKICTESRLSQSLVLCAYRYQQDKNNGYLLQSAKTGWTKLKQICYVKNEDLQKRWREIEISYR